MAKDYFQDIVPPDSPNRSVRPPRKPAMPPAQTVDEPEEAQVDAQQVTSNRSIRDIAPSKTRMKLSGDREIGSGMNLKPSRKWTMWIIAGVGVLAVGVLGIFAFRQSSVDVTPRSQVVTFDATTATFQATRFGASAEGALAFEVFTSDVEDSEPVTAQGLQHVETKASGSITVYNDYSAAPVKLLKDTRFEAPGGLIFKTPVAVSVPGRKGSTPGSITITVNAAEAGDKYNVAAGSFTLPGLKSNDAMYKGVYAKSQAAFIGGFLGDQPAVEPSVLAGAISSVRARLAAKVGDIMQSHEGYISFPSLSVVSYQSLPSTTEAGGGVRIHERAHVEIIAFPKGAFTSALASTVAADAANASILLVPREDFDVRAADAAAAIASGELTFNVLGTAQLIWEVDAAALASTLAGKDESAFQTVITGFPGIQEAHARIQPFWKSRFSADPSRIQVRLLEPGTSQ